MKVPCSVLAFTILSLLGLTFSSEGQKAQRTLLNVSYDPTREFYQEYNQLFSEHWLKTQGEKIAIKQSHGGAGKQARSVIDGLQADVVTLALAYDIDAIHEKADLLPKDWQKRLPHNSCPYTSTIVFLVRQGNPKGIKDWDDLAKPGVEIITPNPKTSGGARWNYLALWGYAMKRWNDETKTRELVSQVFHKVPVLDTGARGSIITFMERGIGDVMLAWENEALMAVHSLGKGKFEMVVPSISILAEPAVALIDQVVDKRRTRDLAEAYLLFLYTEEAQRLVAKHHYRPVIESIAKEVVGKFSEVDMFSIEDMFGSWEKAQKIHFDDGGTFDQIYERR